MPSRVSTSAQSCKRVLIIIGAIGHWACGQSTPTSPTQVVARPMLDGGLTSAAPTSGRGAVASSVSWDCFAGAAGDCATPRVSRQALAAADIVTAPTNLTRFVSGTTVTFGWGAPPGATPASYVIEAGSASGQSNITTFDTGSGATGLTVTNVPPGTYIVRVRGRDGAGIGPPSNEVTVVVSNAGAPGPCQPRNLSAIAIGSTVAMTWVEPPGAGPTCGTDRYLIEVGSSPGASDLRLIETQGLFSSFGAQGLASGTYFVRIRSRGATTVSNPSNEIVITVTGVTPPGTSTWTGLVASGDGVTTNDDDCGEMRWDAAATLVQSGATVTGILTSTVRSAGRCAAFVGFTFIEPMTGTVTGTLAGGAGTFQIATGTTSTVTGAFNNGRLTGNITYIGENATGTVTLNRQ